MAAVRRKLLKTRRLLHPSPSPNVANKKGNHRSSAALGDRMTALHAYLDKLNAEQRSAVEHGAGGAASPLLVIAGGGSGKTNTLAHRVAHLIVLGADPRCILLLTFSRRAAAEMTRRAERILAEAARTAAMEVKCRTPRACWYLFADGYGRRGGNRGAGRDGVARPCAV